MHIQKLKFILFLGLLFIAITSFHLINRKTTSSKDLPLAFWESEQRWVDSVFTSLTDDEKIGQLFMIAAYSNKDMKHVREIRDLIQKQKIGGLIFMQGGPVRQAHLTNYYQRLSKTPLMISIDGEWGLAMRLDSTPSYPRQMTLGAIQNDSLIYKMGVQIAKECSLMGIHVNFAPVADVNNNPNNPVISMRSFGENKQRVAEKAAMYMFGMQDHGVLANGKHFPGHGDTDKDSHKTLPTIKHTAERLDSLELSPFKYLFERKLGSIMVAHLQVPAYDTTKNQATTLSKYVVTDLLKNKLGFKGLIFTDALNMKGASDYNAPGIVDMKALMAGNDVLLFSHDVPKAIAEIKMAMQRGEISQAEIDEHVKKILKAKFWCGLSKKQFVHYKTIVEDLNNSSSNNLNHELAEASVTLLKNEKSIVPIMGLDTLKTAVVSIGNVETNYFSTHLTNYIKHDFFGLPHDAKAADRDSLLLKLKKYNLVILQINKTNQKPDKNFGLTETSSSIADQICAQNKTILCLFSNPYLFNTITFQEKANAVIEMYEYTNFSQKAAVDAILGAIAVNGKLPVTAGKYNYGTGIEIRRAIRIKHSTPEEVGAIKKKLNAIDSLALEGIKTECYPGCQILAMKDGKVFYQKSFGNYTYANDQKVNNASIYDLASVTKIAASSILLMDLVGSGKVDLDKTLKDYLPETIGTDKQDIIIREMISHQAGLDAWLPFNLKTMTKSGEYKPGYYNAHQSAEYPTQVADHLFIKAGYTDTIYKKILDSKMKKRGEYLYSDLGYYFLQRIFEKIYGKKMDEVLKEKFYQPLGLSEFGYQPLTRIEESRIVPTENDTKFRKQLLRGYVHDQGAALMGGVAGHAGLFGKASDVAVLMQMLLNYGNYGGFEYLKPHIVSEFTQSCCYCPALRRGMCFDKPETDPKKDSPVTKECSPMSFGHSGFTGTFVWADPNNNLVYIFLSNRVHPNADENKLTKSGIRGKIHKLLYESLETNVLP